MQHYTYAHIRSDIGSIFYIGKGSTKNRHLSTQSRNKYWHHIVKKHGFKAEILAYWNTAEEAFNHEKLLISCFKDMNIKLSNLTDGGEGSLGLKQSQEQIQKMRQSLIGRKLTAIHKENISEGCKGKVVSNETKEKMSLWQKNKPKTEEAKSKFKKKKSNNISGFHNVGWENHSKKWRVVLTIDGKLRSFGRFEDIELADLVAQEARDLYYGKIVRNF